MIDLALVDTVRRAAIEPFEDMIKARRRRRRRRAAAALRRPRARDTRAKAARRASRSPPLDRAPMIARSRAW